MKDIRPIFTDEEFSGLRAEADQLGVSLKQLVHDRAVNKSPDDNPLMTAQTLAGEIAKNREVLNQIIKREITADIRLYEDDVIRIETAMSELENIVAAFISEILKKVS